MDLLSINWRRQRRAQLVPELDNYPETPQGYYSGYYPGSKAVQSHYIEYRVRLQLVPELNTYPQAAQDEPITAWLTHFEKTGNRTNRKIKGVELNTYPETPVGYYSGYYPGSGLAISGKLSFETRRQDLPELNTYPATVAQAVPTAFETHFEFTKNRTNRKLLNVELNQYPSTPVGYYEGWYPGSALASANKWNFKRTRIDVELNEYPAPPTSPAILPAFLTHFEKTQNWTNRQILGVQLDSYPPTVPVWTLVSDDSTGWTAVTDDSSVWTVANDNSDSWSES